MTASVFLSSFLTTTSCETRVWGEVLQLRRLGINQFCQHCCNLTQRLLFGQLLFLNWFGLMAWNRIRRFPFMTGLNLGKFLVLKQLETDLTQIFAVTCQGNLPLPRLLVWSCIRCLFWLGLRTLGRFQNATLKDKKTERRTGTICLGSCFTTTACSGTGYPSIQQYNWSHKSTPASKHHS